MSNFERVSDVLEHHIQFHHRVHDLYKDMLTNAENEKVKMLIQTLRNHEQQHAQHIKDYIEQAPENTLETYFQYSHDEDEQDMFDNISTPATVTVDHVHDVATLCDNYLEQFYEEMMEAADIPEVKELFENLKENILQEKMKLTVDVTSLLDM
ncbi:ferritin family protein [Flocculibacter collagenilyticus]|uniref:hypothetical protein n=1 Tax=Flocculibacter collagenilyticus TaxID=2744479 RepID=UPI0018F4C3D6|nr:hypothetical protein [Flocculibacter collagenilyticus]